MGLHDGRPAVNVDHKSGQVIAFAVNKAEDVAALAPGKAKRKAELPCAAYARRPEAGVDFGRLEGEYPYRYAAYLVMPYGQELPVGAVYFYNVAFFRRAFDTADGARKYPGMKAQQRIFLAGL
jgi:hypothetical protein